MTFPRICWFLIALCTAAAAPKVNKVEPPNWWTPHTWNRVQLLLNGTDLGGSAVTTTSKGFQIEVPKISENGHYAFVYLTIGKDVRPGVYKFQVKNPSGRDGVRIPAGPSSGYERQVSGLQPRRRDLPVDARPLCRRRPVER